MSICSENINTDIMFSINYLSMFSKFLFYFRSIHPSFRRVGIKGIHKENLQTMSFRGHGATPTAIFLNFPHRIQDQLYMISAITNSIVHCNHLFVVTISFFIVLFFLFVRTVLLAPREGLAEDIPLTTLCVF